MKILTSEERGCRRGPEDWFTGTVWIDDVVAGGAPSRLNSARVSFEPGARTAWHTHPVGQALHVLSRLGAGDALVSGGGDLEVSGAPPGKHGWRIELPPLDTSNAPPAIPRLQPKNRFSSSLRSSIRPSPNCPSLIEFQSCFAFIRGWDLTRLRAVFRSAKSPRESGLIVL